MKKRQVKLKQRRNELVLQNKIHQLEQEVIETQQSLAGIKGLNEYLERKIDKNSKDNRVNRAFLIEQIVKIKLDIQTVEKVRKSAVISGVFYGINAVAIAYLILKVMVTFL